MAEDKKKKPAKKPAAKKTGKGKGKAAAPAAASRKSPAKTPAAKAPKKKSAEKKAAKMITVTQTGSPIGRKGRQRATLIGLGLNKPHRARRLEDTPATRGMINKVRHLVRVDEDAV